jgi:hypothetical protein
VHDTGVVPTAKLVPDAGVHDVVTGAFPPDTPGDGYTTVIVVCPWLAWTARFVGQITEIAGGGGAVGVVPEQRSSKVMPAKQMATRAPVRRKWEAVILSGAALF